MEIAIAIVVIFVGSYVQSSIGFGLAIIAAPVLFFIDPLYVPAPITISALTLSIVAGMSVSDVSQKAIANLGWDKIRLTAPVFVGDTIYAESEILETRETRSRNDRGVVYLESRGFNQRGEKVVEYLYSIIWEYSRGQKSRAS